MPKLGGYTLHVILPYFCESSTARRSGGRDPPGAIVVLNQLHLIVAPYTCPNPEFFTDFFAKIFNCDAPRGEARQRGGSCSKV